MFIESKKYICTWINCEYWLAVNQKGESILNIEKRNNKAIDVSQQIYGQKHLRDLTEAPEIRLMPDRFDSSISIHDVANMYADIIAQSPDAISNLPLFLFSDERALNIIDRGICDYANRATQFGNLSLAEKRFKHQDIVHKLNTALKARAKVASEAATPPKQEAKAKPAVLNPIKPVE